GGVAEAIRTATGGAGPDVVVDFTGAAVAIEAGVDALATGGRLVMCGLGPDRLTLPATNALVRRGSRCSPPTASGATRSSSSWSSWPPAA
ncbi:MAG: zinc-binding dehydrogenase, partial [Solirubrobacteraceae bacterium]